MRIIFMGTPDFAVPTLDALTAAGHDIAAVYCQPPRRAGRGKALTPSPVQRRAEAAGLAVRHPTTLREAADREAFAALGADVAVVAAYGLILPVPVLAAPRFGCLNVHGSLLPRWRGAAPVQRAILAGDANTGVTIMRMEKGLDTGPMLATIATPVAGKTAGDLTAELATRGAALMARVLANLPAFPPVPQPDEGVTYATKIDKAEARLDFTQGPEAVERQVRAFNPAPGAFLEHAGERIRILAATPVAGTTEAGTAEAGTAEAGTVLDEALTIACGTGACGTGAIRPTLVQRAGRAAMPPADLLRGFPIPPGTRLS